MTPSPSTVSSGRSNESAVQVWQRWLLTVVDLGTVGVLVIAPLFMGGRHPLGKFVLAAIVWVMSIAWLARQTLARRAQWSWSGAELLLLLSTLLVVIQVCPLPSGVLQTLSPAQSQLLPLWSTHQPLYGAWQSISLTPERTRQGLCLLLSYVALFLITYQRVRSVADIERLMKWMAMAVVTMAGLGLLQYLIGNGKFLWIYEHPTRHTNYVAKGAFANQNHFAHFLALGAGPLIWWLQDWHRRRGDLVSRFSAHSAAPGASTYGSTLLITGLGIVMFASLLSFSRGGWLVMLLAVSVTGGIYALKGVVDRRTIAVLFGMLLVITTAVLIHGHQRLQTRLNTITDGSLEQIDASRGRRKIWAAVSRAIPNFVVMGAGVGSHRDVYPTFMEEFSEVEYTHAESGYLQILLETGVPGLILLLSAVGLSGYWLVRVLWRSSSRKASLLAGALAAGWAATVMHSLVDFVWYIPACASFAILLAAAAARLFQITFDAERQTTLLSRPGWLVCMIVVAGIAVVGVHAQLGPARAARYWERYLAMSLSAQDAAMERIRQGRELRANEIDDSDPETLTRMTRLLQESLAHNPNDARTHARIAATHLRHFEVLQKRSENAMSLSDIRSAAVMSSFSSKADQDDWLNVAIGEHRQLLDRALLHAELAVSGSPMLGKGYLHLAELSFLEGMNQYRDQLIAQARIARPHDGAVLYLIAAEAHLAGDMETAIPHYRRAFHRSADMQDLIISMLAPIIKPQDFLAAFQPDRIGLGKLYDHYRTNSATMNANFVGHEYVRALEEHGNSATGNVAANSWYRAQEVHAFLKQRPEAVAAARRAVAADPTDYRLRYLLAVRLLENEQPNAALTELRWCLRRRPDDPAVLHRLAQLAHRN